MELTTKFSVGDQFTTDYHPGHTFKVFDINEDGYLTERDDEPEGCRGFGFEDEPHMYPLSVS